MQIICPTCNAQYNLPAEKIPEKRTWATCKKCGGSIEVESTAPAQPVDMTAISSDHHPRSVTSPESGEPALLSLLADYPELQGLDSERFDFVGIFSPNKKGGYKNRKNNLTLKILRAVQDVLAKQILKEAEKVLRIGKATAYYPAEIFFGNGFLTMMYNHYAIVCTDQRLIFVNINAKMNRPTHYFFQMPYEQIERVKRGLLGGSLTLYPFRGKRRTFMYVKALTANELKQFIAGKSHSIKRAGRPEEAHENLCPSCFVPLKKGLVSCPQCRARFKKPKKAFLKSLLLPGLGDIYLGHRALGIFELIGSIIVWLVVLSLLVTMAEAGLIVAIFLLLFYNGLDGSLTYHMASKGYMIVKN